MTASPYLNEPIAMVLLQDLSQAIRTAQAMAENATTVPGEQILPSTAMKIHHQLVEIERCVGLAMGYTPSDP